MTKYELPNIEHLVLSGAGHGIFSYIAAFDILIKNNIINKKNIKTIYGTSAGAIVGTLLLLDIELDVIIDYFVERPWNELFVFDTNVINIVNNYGMWYNEILTKTLQPLFSMRDISLDITMVEFYEKTNVEIYFYATELKSFEEIVFSYKTTPDIKLLDAIYMTCAIPFLFKPMIYNNKYYIDGGFANQYPIKNALNDITDHNTIFGIKNVAEQSYEKINKTEDENPGCDKIEDDNPGCDKTEDDSPKEEKDECDKTTEDEEDDEEEDEEINTLNIFDILQYLLVNPILKLIMPPDSKIYNELNIYSCGKLDIDMIKYTINSHENRLELIKRAKKETEIFIKNKYNISL